MKKIYTTIIACIVALSAFGQISNGGIPLSFTHKISVKSTAVFVVPEFDYKSMLEEDLRQRKTSNRYGKVHNVDLTPLKNGTWQTLSSGYKIWRLSIKSLGAYSLSLIFNNYKLKNGAKIFIYSADKKHIIGAFTEQNNNKSAWFSTIPIQGDEIVIELNTFGNDDYGRLNISGIVHDYKGVMGLKIGYGSASYCNININCEQGADWQIEKKAVVTLYANGQFCTGTLINNTALDSKPYLLTASHCVKSEEGAQGGVYSFNYESEDCKSTSEPIKHSISGAKLIATGGNSLDFTLLELSKPPPIDYDVYYAGWNINPSLTDTNFVCIHHPQGDIKKISIAHDTLKIDNYGYGFDYNSHYRIKEWKVGTTEPGSSGSALFDKEHLIIGDLSGGDANCGYNYDDFYTRLDLCWNHYPEDSKQLKKWLDPMNLGVEKLAGMYQGELTEGFNAAIFNSSTFKSKYCSNDSIVAKFVLKNLGKKALNRLIVRSFINKNIVYENIWTGNLESGKEIPISYNFRTNLLGEITIKTLITLPATQVDNNLINNAISKTISIIKPIDIATIKGNEKICGANNIQKYSANSAGNYRWTITGGEILGDTSLQNIEVQWNRWGNRKLNVSVSNYCNKKTTNINVDFVEQQLILKLDIENNHKNACWHITNYKGDTIAGADNLPASGRYTTNICISEGSYNLIIDKNGANIKNYNLTRISDEQIVLNNLNIDENQIKGKFILNKFKNAYISIYPNPAKQKITIEAYFVELYNNAQFGIFTQSGKTILPYSKFDDRKIIDISHLSKGTYIVKVTSEYGETSGLFIKF